LFAFLQRFTRFFKSVGTQFTVSKRITTSKSVGDDSNHPDTKRSPFKASAFEKVIGYKFKNKETLRTALTHDSHSRIYDAETGKVTTITPSQPYSDYERMEFLGDSVLGLVVAEYLYQRYRKKTEGYLSKLKSNIVSEQYLALKAVNFQLPEYLIMSDIESKNGGRQRKSIIANSVESLICAIYLDGGFAPAKQFILTHIVKGYEKQLLAEEMINFKCILQEYAQSKHLKVPYYHLAETTGPEHAKTFKMIVYIDNKKCGSGTGLSKKEAQQRAAKDACDMLGLKYN